MRLSCLVTRTVCQRSQLRLAHSVRAAALTAPAIPLDARQPLRSMSIAHVDKDSYALQLAAKVEHVKARFADFALPDIDVFDSQTEHYRMRSVGQRVWSHTVMPAQPQQGSCLSPQRSIACCQM